jgi:hypothetical protein
VGARCGRADCTPRTAWHPAPSTASRVCRSVTYVKTPPAPSSSRSASDRPSSSDCTQTLS